MRTNSTSNTYKQSYGKAGGVPQTSGARVDTRKGVQNSVMVQSSMFNPNSNQPQAPSYTISGGAAASQTIQDASTDAQSGSRRASSTGTGTQPMRYTNNFMASTVSS